MKVSIIGAGAYGMALGGILEANGYEVDYYDSLLEKPLDEVTLGSSFTVLAIPSDVAPELLPKLPRHIPLIVATKGFLSDILFRDFDDYMVLSGPGFAGDIVARKATRLTATDQRIADMFTTDFLTFDYTTDKKGVLMCGALKNVYAIQAGLLGLERGSTSWQDYIKAVCEEMKMILATNGASPDTVDLVCGKEDLELTCGYPSRNYEYGDKLRQNPSYKAEKTVEGLAAISRLNRHEIEIPKQATILHKIMLKFSHES